ncbi:MAG TPA: hypothetical protein VH640_11720, partial [Bryobacteraceae bacterium]
MCEKSALIDLRSSMDELRETRATNRKLRGELRQLKTMALSSSYVALGNSNEAAKPAAPFEWWIY